MKHIKTFESFQSFKQEDELNEGLFKKTPEELLEKGKKSLNKDQKMTRIYNTIVSEVKSGKYPAGAENKYLMFYAKTGDTFATWYSWLEAPDGTEGYWGARGLTRGVGGSGKNMGA